MEKSQKPAPRPALPNEYAQGEFVLCRIGGLGPKEVEHFGTVVDILPDDYYVVEMIHNMGFLSVPVERMMKASRA